MTKKSKIIYIVGSVAIGIIAALIIIFGLMLGGVINTRGNKLVISSVSREFVYNGEERSDGGWQLVSGKLANGHKVIAEVTGKQKDAGSSLNYISATVVDKDGADVTSSYDIDYRTGTITVLARPVTLTTAGREKTYDGEELSLPEWEITKGSLVKGQEISVTMSAAITDAGEVENSAAAQIFDGGTDVTSNYDITYDTGVLKVKPIELHFITPTLSKTYDGTPLFSDPEEYEWVSGSLLKGHYVRSMKVIGLIKDIGSVENAVEIKIAGANGADISHNYKAVTDEGTLTVRGFGITISTSSSEKIYDGTPLVNPEWTLHASTPLIAGHKITTLVMPASQTNAGSSPNEITQLVISGENGEDVTANYEINYSIGTLVVLPRQLTVQSGSATKNYDGKPLTCKEWKFTSVYGPVSGHRAEAVITGTITEPGQRDNTIAQVIIWDGNGKDATGNYEITVDEGLLIVKGEGTGPNTGDLDQSGNISGGVSGGPGSGQEPSVALAVKTQSGGAVYLRLKSFGGYNGTKWSEAREYSKTYSGYSFNYLTGFALQRAGYVPENINISVYGTGYYLPYYMASGEYDYDIQTSDVYNKGSSENYSLKYYPYDYLSEPDLTALEGSDVNDYTAFVHANYTAVPASARDYLQSVIDSRNWKISDKDVIEKVALYIRNAATYNLEYDRTLDSQNEIVVAFLKDYKEGICQHYASAATLMFRQLGIPARYTIGYVADTVAGEWTEVTTENAHAWVEVYIDGAGWVQIEVTGGDFAGGILGPDGSGGSNGGSGTDGEYEELFTVSPVKEYYKYDGRTAFRHSGAVRGLSSLTEKGFTYRAQISGSFKAPGKYSVSIVSLEIFNAAGEDVTAQYAVTFKKGVLQVYQYEITVATGGASKTYDGLALTSDECKISQGHLAEGHSFEYFNTTASRTDAGVSINSYRLKIIDRGGEDVTFKYKINSSYGLLAVTAREITLTAGSAHKVYDGVPLTCNKYEITAGTLAEGQVCRVVVSGSNPGKAGSAENKILSASVSDADGRDVTANYKITTVNGLLTVYPN